MAGWTTLEKLLKGEIIQREEEGCDVTGFAKRLEEAAGDNGRLNRLYDELMELKPGEDFPFEEPDSLEEIRACQPKAEPWKPAAGEIDYDFFYGAWLGRCCGCALGKPLETGVFMSGKDGIPGWKLAYEWSRQAGQYPVKTYTPIASPAGSVYGIETVDYGRKSTLENIEYMETDDDIRYTVLGLKLMEEKGTDFTTLDVGHFWLANLPYEMVCTAEKQAYLNLCQEYDLLKEGKEEEFIQWVRSYRNPYREWIGAQIRVDGYAYGAAGNPGLAAELAFKDASLSHVKNGIYGAMFCSAMIAAAFTEKDNRKIIEAGLSQIPVNSRLAADIKTAVRIAESAKSQLELLEKIWNEFAHYNAVHTNNNAALCAAAILFAGDDFETAITTAVLGGWDTDCNGATVGSVMGAKLGAGKIPERWKAPLHDTLYSAVPGFHPIAISECAKRSQDVYRKVTQK